MKLTKKSDYALRILISLAALPQGEVLTTKSIAESNDISLKFLQNVVSELVKHDIIESLPGPKGGNRLLSDPHHLSVLQVIEIIEGSMSLMDCMEESTQCQKFNYCKLHSLFGRAQFAMNEVLASCHLSDLVECPAVNY
jgi:Rrf2 family protein